MGAPQDIEIASASGFHEFSRLNLSAAVNFIENLVIPQFSVHGPRGVDSNNFFVSQRLTVILAGNLLEVRADQTIVTHFTITSFTFTKNQVKVRKPPDRTTAFRGASAPVDDITLRRNHSTTHLG